MNSDAVIITIVILCLTIIFDFMDKQLRKQLATFKSTIIMVCFLYAFSFAFLYQNNGNVKFTVRFSGIGCKNKSSVLLPGTAVSENRGLIHGSRLFLLENLMPI